jgi:demethylmenaquinone methyltransferase/2-methoxy-6-polyprenyl-1,4-benzoquinol methylase
MKAWRIFLFLGRGGFLPIIENHKPKSAQYQVFSFFVNFLSTPLKNRPFFMILPTMRKDIMDMFEAISPRYDLLNHLLSLYLDLYWRRRAISEIHGEERGRVLDIAAGTGDLSLAARTLRPSLVVALDFAPRMLHAAQRKFMRRTGCVSTDGSKTNTSCVAADAGHLPFRDSSFDAAMVAFGMRNFPDRPAALHEMHRVLKNGGVVCVLEFTRLRRGVFASIFRWYFHRVLPLVGRLVSGHPSAHKYLPESVDDFPTAQQFLDLMRRVGFEKPRCVPLTFGVASIFMGRKP